jgi:hypothetical protein
MEIISLGRATNALFEARGARRSLHGAAVMG